ncbi:Uncharacterised protein [Mycobacteroides abscessus subsp. abscessus]|nr:Uncharacterised protein [Mycobacteroides abscessus subsp. abscessus]
MIREASWSRSWARKFGLRRNSYTSSGSSMLRCSSMCTDCANDSLNRADSARTGSVTGPRTSGIICLAHLSSSPKISLVFAIRAFRSEGEASSAVSIGTKCSLLTLGGH